MTPAAVKVGPVSVVPEAVEWLIELENAGSGQSLPVDAD